MLLAGEKMTDEEVNELLMGQEDAQGNVNYEGVCLGTGSGCLVNSTYIWN